MFKKFEAYFKKHIYQNSFSHLLIGLGLGILFTYPYFGVHPVRWGIAFLVLGGVIHLLPLTSKK